MILALSVSPAQNLLPNSSFEVWLDTIGVNMPLGWITSELIRPGSAAKSTDAHTGNFAVELSSADTAAFVTTTTMVRAGTSYNFAGYAKTTSVLGGSFVISWLSLLGGSVGTPALVPVYRSTSYREFTRQVTAPESAFFCVVALATLPGPTVYVDDVTLEEVVGGIRSSRPVVGQRFHLYPAQPNPFADVTVINYSLSVGDVASLRIYDLVGNEVRTLVNDYRPAGFYTAFWNSTDEDGAALSPGIYFCRLQVADLTLTQKLILLGE